MTADKTERRRAVRRPILDSFSLFVVVPKKGVHRLKVHDVSQLGIGFEVDTEGENFSDFPLAPGESLDLHFYLNQSLFLPLTVDVARIDERGVTRRVGAQFKDKDARNYKAYLSFLQMLESIVEVARLNG